MKFKRDRKILNKAELTHLRRQFDACVGEIVALEKSKRENATIMSIIIELIGTAFMAGLFICRDSRIAHDNTVYPSRHTGIYWLAFTVFLF